ncbi:hypothetical protein [uncultured Mediterranean phage uvMED]|nr:hypothetical protein [uncultured Mediterranean phage uvMED]BAQ87011.1 hypothetical protein [uncultured Mediterranean phage uvMED]BAQ87067.1 hypothetical protein [uncultured Mediterranean phage uvMED]BAR16625.1 hypothetical protein [uncultured Mediterranean phage uvMED]
MGVKKKKLVPPSPKGGTSPKAEPKMEPNRVQLGSRATIGNRAKLGVKV